MASMGEVQVRVQVEHPLVCLNEHPEHQWEDSGMCLSKPYREELKDGAGRVRGVHRGMVKGPAVEACSRPGCGLIRVRQEKKPNPLLCTDPLTREQFKELDSSIKRQAEMKSKPVLTIIDEATGIEDEVYDKAQEWAKKKVEVVGSLPQPRDPYPEVRVEFPDGSSFVGTPISVTKEDVLDILDEIKTTYKECERCNLLTPVSELSRDAQGRMVCKHH